MMCSLAPSISSVTTPRVTHKNLDLGLLDGQFPKNSNTNAISTIFPVDSCAKSGDQKFGSIKFQNQGNACSLRDLRTWASTIGPSIEYGGDGGKGSGIGNNNSGGGGGGESSGWEGKSEDNNNGKNMGGGLLGAFLRGWRSRVEADPEFSFKVLMEELVGVTGCCLGDMASRPNFGLNELDFVFSTLVVGSIVNFVLMYLLAPSAAMSAHTLPGLFSSCPTSHMFETGSFSVLERLGTFVYKGTLFAAVGFAAGLVGTALSNTLISVKKKMDPNFETPNKPPPTLLNAATWAIHMGLSSNLRYQTLNGIEFLLAKGFTPLMFKTSVVVLRGLNNVLGGMSFVVLARLTGSQKVDVAPPSSQEERAKLLLDQGKDLQSEQSA